MPRKHRAKASRARTAPIPPTVSEPTVERPRDLADRRDLPAPDHANLGPDDRASPHLDDVEADGTERIHDVDAAVIEGGASEVELH
jgi:hypothetical protein